MALAHIWGYEMKEIIVLQKRIDKLERDHKAYIEFGAMCFIGILASGMIIDHTHNHSLWFLIILLLISFIASIVIGVQADMEKDELSKELQRICSSEPTV